MEDFNLDKYKSAWQEEKHFQSPVLTGADIRGFMKRRSKNMLQQFKMGLVVDIAIKIILLLASGTLCLLYPFGSSAWLTGISVALLTLFGIGLQWKVYKQLPAQNQARKNLLHLLKTYVDFYKNIYIKTIFIAAITGPLVFINGALFYYYFKYGRIPSLSVMDFVILGTFLGLSYALSLIVQLNHNQFQLREYENCIKELEENSMTRVGINRYESMRKIILIAFGIALLIGLAIFIFLIIQ